MTLKELGQKCCFINDRKKIFVKIPMQNYPLGFEDIIEKFN